MLKRFATHTLTRSAALAALLACAAPALAQAPYTGCSVPEAEAEVCAALIDLGMDARAFGISGNGQVVVGSLADLPALWQRNGEPLPFPGLPADVRCGQARVASYDGSVVAGTLCADSLSTRPVHFRWELGSFDFLVGWWAEWVLDISNDGSTVSGFDDGPFAWLWSSSGKTRLAGPGDGWNYYLRPNALSEDGSIAVGDLDFAHFPSREPVIWLENELVYLIDQPHGPLDECPGICGSATGISPDGRVIVGTLKSKPFERLAVRWSDGVLEYLGTGPFDYTWANDVSADGQVVVGKGRSSGWPLGTHEAFVWDEVNGVQRLATILEDRGIDTSESVLGSANSVSDDGAVVVTGRFIADLGFALGIDIAPGQADNVIDLARERFVSVRIFGTELLDVDDIDVDALAFGPDAAPVEHAFQPRDANRDGYLDLDVRFETGETGIAAGDAEACLSGRAMGLPFEVCGPIEATLFGFGPGGENSGCGRGFEAALALPALLWLRRRSRCPLLASASRRAR